MVTHREINSQTLCRETIFLIHNFKWECSIKSLFSELRQPHGRGGRKSIRAKWNGGHPDFKYEQLFIKLNFNVIIK